MKKKVKFQEISTHLGVFDVEVVTLFTPDKEKAVKYVNWKQARGVLEKVTAAMMGRARGFYFFKKDYIPIIWLPRRPQTPTEYGTLAHEVFHVTKEVMAWVPVPSLSEETEEVWCHTIGFLVKDILEKSKKGRGKKSEVRSQK